MPAISERLGLAGAEAASNAIAYQANTSCCRRRANTMASAPTIVAPGEPPLVVGLAGRREIGIARHAVRRRICEDIALLEQERLGPPEDVAVTRSRVRSFPSGCERRQ